MVSDIESWQGNFGFRIVRWHDYPTQSVSKSIPIPIAILLPLANGGQTYMMYREFNAAQVPCMGAVVAVVATTAPTLTENFADFNIW